MELKFGTRTYTEEETEAIKNIVANRQLKAAEEPEPTEWLSERLANGNDLSLEEAKRLADNRAAASERQLKAAYDKAYDKGYDEGYLDGLQVEREWY